jgi:transposase
MRRRHQLSDAEWERLQPLLPPHRAGRARRDDRQICNGLVWKLATGAPWRDLPERSGPWPRVYPRFRRWTLAGVWARRFAAVQRQADATGPLAWTVHVVDGTVIRADPHAAGAKGGTRRPRRWARARAASRRRSTSERRAAASRCPWS